MGPVLSDAWEAMRVPLESDDNRVTRPTCGPAEWFENHAKREALQAALNGEPAPFTPFETVGYCRIEERQATEGNWSKAFDDAAPTELRPPSEHAGHGSLHWIAGKTDAKSINAVVWRWWSRDGGKWVNDIGNEYTPEIAGDGYRYLGPAEWRPDHVPVHKDWVAAFNRMEDEVASWADSFERLAAENAKLRADLRTLMASAARPLLAVEAPPLPTSHTACRHCGTPFLAEVVAAHEASCELRPAVEMVVF